VVLVFVEYEGWSIGPRASELAANEPPSRMDCAANESEVTTPGFSFFGSFCDRGSVVTCIYHQQQFILWRSACRTLVPCEDAILFFYY
jgi:hypothetical protein